MTKCLKKPYTKGIPFFIPGSSVKKVGKEHPNTRTVANNLIYFWQTAITEGRTEELKLLHEYPLRKLFLENNIDQE